MRTLLTLVADVLTSSTRISAVAILVVLTMCGDVRSAGPKIPDNKKLGTVYNNDINIILNSLPGRKTTPSDYKAVVLDLLDAGPGVLAQNVGMPDPVIYRSKVATLWSKHYEEVIRAMAPKHSDISESSIKQALVIDALVAAGTDPLAITIEACRERGVPIVASYRMNAEDFYGGELDMYDFGRQNKDLRIAGHNCLDPAHPEVYNHRMAIFTEVANNYDIDGIEFDFKRWYHMISDPHKNHPVLTRMVQLAGGEVALSRVIGDSKDALRTFLAEAIETCQMVVSTGGVSMGRFDFVRDVMLELGVEERFWKVAQKPGKPLFFGQSGSVMVFGLPGNPVSALIIFMEYIWPTLEQFQGLRPTGKLTAILAEPFPVDGGKHRFLFGQVWLEEGCLRAAPTRKLGSHMLTSALGANAILDAPPGTGPLRAEDPVSVRLLPWGAIHAHRATP